MFKKDTSGLYISKSLFLVGAALLFVSACGLGLTTEDRFVRAQEAFQSGEFRAAIIDSKNVLQEEPNNRAARVLLGRASVAVGDGASAEKELRRAVELGEAPEALLADLGLALLLQGKYSEVMSEISPETATTDSARLTAMRIRGDALIGLQQPAEAREIYQAVLKENSEDAAAQLGIVNSYIGERNFPQARETLNQLLTFDDSNVQAWLTSGFLSMGFQDAAKAESDYRKAASLAAGYVDVNGELQAQFGLAEALLAQAKIEEARAQWNRMQEIAAEDPRTLLVAGMVATEDQDWVTAQENLQQVLVQTPDNQQAQMLLGVVHKESGNLGQAEMYLSSVVAAVPDNISARQILAETRLLQNKADEARQIMAPMVNVPEADAGSLSMAARASLDMGEFDDATELLRRGVAANPGNIDLQLQLAFTLFQSGNTEEAQQILSELPESSNDQKELQRDSLLILTQMAQGQTDEAVRNVAALVERWPAEAAAYNLAGATEMWVGNNAVARERFEAAIRLAPEDLGSMRYLAQLDEIEEDIEAARVRHAVILELQPNDVASMVAMARLAARGENFEESRDWLEKARGVDSTAVLPRRILGSLYLAFNDFVAAEEVAKEAIDLDDGDARLHNILGLAQLYQNDDGNAASSFRRAIELDGEDKSYRLNLAKVQIKGGNTESAIASLQSSEESLLQDIPSAVLVASLKAQEGDHEGARKIALQLQELHADAAEPFALEAELLAQKGDLLGAVEVYDKAMSIEHSQRYAVRSYQIRSQAGLANQVDPLIAYLEKRPLDNNMRIYLAQAHQNAEEFGRATVHYEQALAREPDSFVAANNLAWNYLITGDSRAEETARRAYEINSESSSVVDTLGWILVKKGKLSDGIEVLRSAVELGDSQPEIRYHLAAALAESGTSDEAKSILDEILTDDAEFPSLEDARKLRSTL